MPIATCDMEVWLPSTETDPQREIAEFSVPVAIQFDIEHHGCVWGFDLDVLYDVSRGRTYGIRLGVVHYAGSDRYSDRLPDDCREWCRRDHPEDIAAFERLVLRHYLPVVHDKTLRAVVAALKGGQR